MSGFSSGLLSLTPEGYWRLGEPSGTTAADSSGNSRNGTYTGTYTLGSASLVPSDVTDKSVDLLASGYVQVSHYANINIGSAFSVFFRMKRTNKSADHALFHKGDYGSSGNQGMCAHAASGTNDVVILHFNGSWRSVTVSNCLPETNTCTIAFIYSGGTSAKLIVDGSSVYSITLAAAFLNSSSALQIGTERTSSTYAKKFNGQIDEFAWFSYAITEANALYLHNLALYAATLSGTVQDSTSAYAARMVRAFRRDTGELVGQTVSDASTGAWSIGTPTTGEHFAIVHDGTADPYWGNCVLAMPFSDTALSDLKGHPITLGGSIARSATQAPFGGYSAYFNGSTTYLETPYNAFEFNWWRVPCTIRCKIYLNSYTGTSYLSGIQIPTLIGNANLTGTNNYWSFGPINGGTLRFYYYNGSGQSVSSTATVPLTTWTDIELDVDSNGIRLSVGGTSTTSTAISGTPQSSTTYNLVMGKINNTVLNAYVCDFQIYTGKALHTASFTPSSSAFVQGVTGGAENALIYDRVVPV